MEALSSHGIAVSYFGNISHLVLKAKARKSLYIQIIIYFIANYLSKKQLDSEHTMHIFLWSNLVIGRR